MRKLLVMALLAGCASVPPATSADGGVDPIAQPMIDAHNGVRGSAMPVPDPALEKMTWNESTAAIAREWAARCEFMHSNNGLGENLAAFAGQKATPAKVVADWSSEVKDYTYSNNTCASGKACGHYTQVVWRKSVKLGCAVQQCSKNSPFKGFPDWELWVCNYEPAGNIVGQKPY